MGAEIGGEPLEAFLSEPIIAPVAYTPKHSSWLNEIEVASVVITRKVIRRGSFTSVKDLRDKLSNFIDLFKSSIRLSLPLDVHGSPADGEARGVKQGKATKEGKMAVSLAFNCGFLD